MQQSLVTGMARSPVPRRYGYVMLYATVNQQAAIDTRCDAGDACSTAAADAGGRPWRRQLT